MTIDIFGFKIAIYYVVILLPALAGLFGFVVNRLRTEFDFLAFVLTLYFSIQIFINTRTNIISYSITEIAGIDFRFYIDNLAGFILLLNAIFAFLVWVYALRSMSKMPGERGYHIYLTITLAAANGVVLSGNLIFLLIFWNILVFSLYGLLLIGKKDSSFTARKALTIIGFADYLMMLGIVILFVRTGSADFPMQNKIILADTWFIISYVLILVGAIAKVGAMPLHSWIPEAARTVPASTLAYIPGSLDKLLGVYLLLRISYFIFDISHIMGLRILLMVVGVVSIVFMAIAALWQKDIQKTLAFSTVSQAGYMVLGLGTGVPIAIAGAFFHMLNNILYKSVLFLSAGSVEHRTKTTDIDLLGGLGIKMPFTLFSFLIAALALSGVPPLNGFYSKWMIYQGIIELSNEIPYWFIFLICAMFGSVLTLAYSLKLIQGIFLGGRPRELDKVRETRLEMVAPSLVLAIACIVFGVFAQANPLQKLIFSALPFKILGVGFYSPTLATILIIMGIVIGLILFLFGSAMRPRRSSMFIGGEVIEEDVVRIPASGFYSSLRSFAMLDKTLIFSEGGAFDFYNYLLGITGGFAVVFKNVINQLFVAFFKAIGRIVRSLAGIVSLLHNGELSNYIGWIFLGGIIILILLVF